MNTFSFLLVVLDLVLDLLLLLRDRRRLFIEYNHKEASE